MKILRIKKFLTPFTFHPNLVRLSTCSVAGRLNKCQQEVVNIENQFLGLLSTDSNH